MGESPLESLREAVLEERRALGYLCTLVGMLVGGIFSHVAIHGVSHEVDSRFRYAFFFLLAGIGLLVAIWLRRRSAS